MKTSSAIFVSALVLSSCLPQTTMMDHSSMQMGQGMMGNEQSSPDALTAQDPRNFPEAKTTEVMNITDGDTIELKAQKVRKIFNGKEVVAYGYNGQLPGPTLSVTQGSTFTVKFTNAIDLPTAVHWHGLRLDNASDGAVGMTQKAVEPDGTFTYTITVPDEGVYWYHPHVREDVEQDLGLYGAIVVTPNNATSYAPVQSQHVVFVDDILLEQDGGVSGYGKTEANFAMMGRFGNTFLINGQRSLSLQADAGSVLRFAFINAANARPFILEIPGAKMKLVGGDSGRYERETFVSSVTLQPSERSIVDVLFDAPGTFSLRHHSPDRTVTLGTVTVASTRVAQSYAKEFATLRSHADVIASVDPFRSSFAQEPDQTLRLEMAMGHGMGGMGMSGGVPAGGIEWEDDMGHMNAMSAAPMVQWKLIDEASGAVNDDIHYTWKKGGKIKIRIVNSASSMHPMQHPIHIHGNRFLVVSDNGKATENHVWKDTVSVLAGHTVDILVDASNPGDWMIHCHIAEHLTNGMMAMVRVQ